MKIQKFLHSCLLIEEGDARILIDPGSWSFGEKFLSIDQAPKIDAILITHSHQDHLNPENINAFITRDQCAVYANSEIVKLLTDQQISASTIQVPETLQIGGINVTSTEAPHGELPFPRVLNNGFWIGDKLFNPGDSHEFEKALTKSPEALALPILAPWGTFTKAIEIALRLKPKHVIPVHDGLVAEIFRHNLLKYCKNILEKADIQVHLLEPGETLVV